MRIGGEDVKIQQYCLSCHSSMNYNLALCEVCAPWTLPENTPNPEVWVDLKQITMFEFLSDDNYQDLVLRGMPDNDDSWRDLLSSIITLSVGESESPLHEQFLKDTDELLSLIAHIRDRIDEFTDKLSRRENLALSYYSHFVDLDHSEILDDEEENIVQFEVRNQNVIFRVVRLKGDGVPDHAYMYSKPAILHSDYYAEIVSINGHSVSFDYKDLEGCAEIILMLGVRNQVMGGLVESFNLQYCKIIEKLQSHKCKPFINESLRFLPNSVTILTEIDRIVNGEYGYLSRDLLLCSLFRFDNEKWIQRVQDPARTKSFQFLKQIISELGSKVSPTEEGFVVTSITANCYKVDRSDFLSPLEGPQVFWTVRDVFNQKSVCIEVEQEHYLPTGDILAVILLSLYDDIESAELITTLNV